MKFYKVDQTDIVDNSKGITSVVFYTNRTVALSEANKSFRRFKEFTKNYKKWEKKTKRLMETENLAESTAVPEFLSDMPISEFFTHGNGGVKVLECETNEDLTSKTVLLNALNGNDETWDYQNVIWKKEIN